MIPEIFRRTAQIDWLSLSGSTPIQGARAVLDMAALGDAEETNPTRWYSRSIVYPHSNIRLQFENKSKPDNWLVTIPGTGCNMYAEKLPRLVRDLHQETECQATRIDCAVDLLSSVEHQGFEKTFVTVKAGAGERGPGRLSNYGVAFDSVESTKGTTFYIGGRSSDRMVRLYDKGAEQGSGWYSWIRYEAQFMRDVARTMWGRLIESDDWTEFAQAYAGGAIPRFHQVNPDLSRALFEGKAERPTIEHHLAHLEAWVEYAKTAVFGRLSMAAAETGLDPRDIAEALGLFDAKPTNRDVRHAGFLSALQHRVCDIMDTA